MTEERQGASRKACRALRGNETLASLVYDASQFSPTWLARGQRRGQSHVRHCHGHTGKPDLSCRQTGKPQNADGAVSNTPCIMPLASSTPNTGRFLRDAKDGRQEDRGDPGRNANALGKCRMGRRSRSPGTPDTRGIFPIAKAPSLGSASA